MKKITKYALGTSSVMLFTKKITDKIDTSYYNVSSEKIPQDFNNFKIAHISDYHNDPHIGIISRIKLEHPDIIVMTGDMTDDKKGSYQPALLFIKKLIKIAPCYIVSGNHDTWRSDYTDYVDDCKKAGAVFLQNDYTTLERNNSKIIISGMEDPFTKIHYKSKIKEYLSKFNTSSDYQILLFHRANLLDHIKDYGFDLILSGHLHGGQLRIPGMGGVFSPLSSLGDGSKILFPKYSGGEYKSENTTMIVNRGIGNPMIIPRVFNRPEIGIITLFHKDAF